MNIFLYIILAVIGTIFGSFFTLAVYRIPRKENIIYVRSHCTSCNHRLEFLDLIPVLSYIFLGGKCRYCKETIRPRYLILEVLSGLVFLLIALAMNINVFSTISEFLTYACTVITVSVLCILMGIGKNINISVVMFGFLIRTIYLIFLDTSNFLQIILETMIFIDVSLIIFLIVNKYFATKNKDFDSNYPNAIGTILFVGLLIYIFEIQLAMIVMALGIIGGIISKYIFKKNIDYIMWISLISIFALTIISSSIVYQYIINIF